MATLPKLRSWAFNSVLTSVFLLSAARLSAQTEADSAFHSDLNFAQALKQASKDGKLVFVDFFTTWCPPCKELDKTTWQDRGVIRLLKEKTIALKLDAEKETALASKYSVTAYPTLALIRPDGSLVDKLVGYRDAPTFTKEISALLAGKTMAGMAEDAVKEAGSDPEKLAKARFELGQQLMNGGKNKEALEEFLWCFDDGMKNIPAYAGVRQSYLLSDIAQLGASYPPALEALRSRREKDRPLAAADPKVAMEYMALNRALGDNAETLSFYESLAAGTPAKDVLGQTVFGIYLESKIYLKAIAAFPLSKYREMMGRFPASMASMPGMKEYLDSSAANEVEALAGSGKVDDARALIKEMLARDGSTEMRELISKRLKRAGASQLMADAPASAGSPAAADASAGPAVGAPDAAEAPKDEPPPPEIEKSTVKIFVTKRGPNVFQPWMKEQPRDITASGVVIEGKLILTTAQAISYSNDIQVQANLAGDKISATVVLMNWSMNLAVLKLDDESFFDSHPPIPRAEGLPLIKDPLLVYGFPVGGSSLSVTKGIISRVEYSGGFPEYTLRIQIDAAINEGNAGGPAVSNGKMVGIALNHLSNAEKIGYVIPNEEIEIFLRDLASGTPAEAPNYYDFCQDAENPTLRLFLGLPKDASGVAVRTLYNQGADYPIKQWDVIQKIGSYAVDDQGMVRVGELRLDFHYAIRKEAKDGKVPMDILRGGKALHVLVPLSKREMLVPGVNGLYPPYFIYGPIVFTKATQALCVEAMERRNLRGTLGWDRSPIAERRGDTTAFPGEEIVVVPGQFFPNDIVKGYNQRPFVHTVDTVNGIKVKNLQHLVEILRDATGDYVTIAFAERFKGVVVLPRKETLAATDGILADNSVRSQGSPDLLRVWNAKTTP